MLTEASDVLDNIRYLPDKRRGDPDHALEKWDVA